MRFAWMLAAVAALWGGQANATIVIIDHVFNNTIYHTRINDPVLELLELTGTPGAEILTGNLSSTPVLGTFDANGLFSLAAPLALTTGGNYGNSLYITLRSYQPGTWNLADVVVTKIRVVGVYAAAPEPSTWALLLIGVGATGVALRRRVRPSVSHRTFLPV